MVAAGDIIEVEVVSVAVFGLFCRYGEQEVLVLIPEISWIASYNSCEQFASPGDRFRVKVLRVDAESGQVSGSIIALHPNPWQSDQLALGTEYRARVVRPVANADRCGGAPGYLLELLPGAYVMMCGGPHLECGQVRSVKIIASDAFKRSVQVALA